MRSKIRTRILRPTCALLAAAMLTAGTLSLHGEARAASAADFENDSDVRSQQQKIADIERRQEDLKNTISSLENDIAGYMKQKETYDALIETYHQNIEAKEELIDLLNAEAEKLDAEITEKREESDELYERMKARMVISQKSGGSRATYLELIFGAKNLFDFVVGISNATRLMEYDSNMLNDYKALTADLEADLEGHQKSLTEADEAKKSLEAEQADMEKTLDSCIQAMQAAQAMISQDEEAANQLANEKALAEAELNAIIERLVRQNGATQNVAEGEYMWPLETRYNYITSYFGGRLDPINGLPSNHGALDIYAPYGSSIFATNNGTVVFAQYTGGSYGNYIIIDHGGNIFSLYAHTSVIRVTEGQYVEKGTHIADVGVSGRVTGAHLHFEMRIGTERVDPLGYVRQP